MLSVYIQQVYRMRESGGVGGAGGDAEFMQYRIFIRDGVFVRAQRRAVSIPRHLQAPAHDVIRTGPGVGKGAQGAGRRSARGEARHIRGIGFADDERVAAAVLRES